MNLIEQITGRLKCTVRSRKYSKKRTMGNIHISKETYYDILLGDLEKTRCKGYADNVS